VDEAFAQGDSLLHRTDPKVKVLVAAVFVTVVAISSSFTAAAMALGCSLLLVLIARLDLTKVAKRLLAANSFTLFLWLTLPLTYGGSDQLPLGALSLSRAGIDLAALITLKTNVIVLAIVGLLGTSRIASVGHALEALGVPQRLCFLLLFSYRYIFVIYQEYQRLVRAAKLRCFIPRTNIHTYRTYGYLFGMTLIRSWNRSFRVHQAMLLRGFNGRLIPLDTQQLCRRDLVFLATGLLVTGGLIVVQLL
jgi:cobalt/nickel transport system permease protein